MAAWGAITAIRQDPQAAMTALAQYVDAVQVALDDTVVSGLRPTTLSLAEFAGAVFTVVRSLRDAVNRTAGWVWLYMIVPVWHGLDIKINTLNAQTAVKIADTRAFAYTLYLDAVRVATTLNRDERNARIADVNLARAQAQALTQALHQAIEHEAASGYAAGKGDRSGPLSALVADLHARGLINAVVNTLLVRAISVLLTTGDPALEAAVTRVISAVIKKSGLGSDLGNYLYGLIIPGQGGPEPKDLPSVVSDISHRLGAIEDWITGFMLDGGPEVKDAGRQWKTITSLTVDAALLAFFGQAVAAPEAWAREVSDTVGTVANDAASGIVALLHQV